MTTPKADYTAWKRTTTKIGCVFARLIAAKPSRFGQVVEIVTASKNPSVIAASIEKRVAKHIQLPTSNALVLLFPFIDDLKTLAGGLVALKDNPNWHVSTSALSHPDAGEVVRIALNRDLPFQGGIIPSEALILGPFQEFAPTRRSPVPALEIFVGESPIVDPKTGEVPTKANLAHIDVSQSLKSVPGHDPVAAMWKKSQVKRLESLGGKEDARAKAKVALVVSKALAEELGIAP
jgi:hypothetical protein